MPDIGTIFVNLHSTDKDETVYARADHNLTHTDTVALRRTLPARGSSAPLRTNLRFERSFPAATAAGTVEKPVTLSVAVTAPPGVDPEAVENFIQEAMTQGAATAASLGITGDIHL